MRTESGNRISETANFLGMTSHTVEGVLNKVAAHGLGKFYSRRIYLEKGQKQREPFYERKAPPVITKCYIEFPGSCDLGCHFCESPKLYPCTMCSKSCENPCQKDLVYGFLSRLFKMQCRAIIFHGGDPFLNKERLFPLVEFCRREGFSGEILVITNATHIGEAELKWLKHYRVHPVIPIALESETGLGMKEQLLPLTQILHQQDIEFSLTFVINGDNPNSACEMRHAERFGARHIWRTVYVDTPERKPIEGIRSLGKQFLRTTETVFRHNANYHPCLHGTLAVSVSGNLLPCPFLKDEVLGHITEPWLIDRIFETRLIDKYWRMPLSKVDKCKDCAFRYGCLDCRAIEKQLSGSLYGKLLCPMM